MGAGLQGSIKLAPPLAPLFMLALSGNNLTGVGVGVFGCIGCGV